jgi:hypothetical protein
MAFPLRSLLNTPKEEAAHLTAQEVVDMTKVSDERLRSIPLNWRGLLPGRSPTVLAASRVCAARLKSPFLPVAVLFFLHFVADEIL